MTKRFGFTLAEVLITLGIIGVVAALTMPTFTAKTATAKVGPQLAKAVAMFEQANKALLAEKESDSLIGSGIFTSQDENSQNYWKALSPFLAGSIRSTNGYVTTDGIFYSTNEQLSTSCMAGSSNNYPSKCMIAKNVVIDLNGLDRTPNKAGKDRFYFKMFDDGSLAPWGAMGDAPRGDSANNWSEKCPSNAAPASNNDAKYCTASIFDNGLKVMYK